MQIVDRRLNPKAKSLGNRQRFMRRAKAEIRAAAREALKKRRIDQVDGGERISISTKSLREPSFGLNGDTGTRDIVIPGNQDFTVGDTIARPPAGGGSGSKGSPDGSGEDDFIFTLTREEFLDLFFEDLKLPNLVKVQLKSLKAAKLARAGFAKEGSPSKLNAARTMRNSLGRRMAMQRPSLARIEALEAELAAAEAEMQPNTARIALLSEQLRRLQHLRKSVAFVDPIDLRYNRHERRPRPTTQAVMFCLMDVSASMTEPLKELAKRFFMLLNVFLKRHYQEVDIVFIRHTTEAQEVDETAFFEATSTGGTVISTALEEMRRVIAGRYPPSEWNIYAAQASDGHNVSDDMAICVEILQKQLLPVCQHYAYIEVREPGSSLVPNSVVWRAYSSLEKATSNFAARHASEAGEIYPVFRELFAAEKSTA